MLKRLLLVAILLLVQVPYARAEIKNCYLCGERITGKYWEHNGPDGNKIFCDRCYRSSPKCAACRAPSKRETLTKVGREYLCPSCKARAKFCSLCGNRISGRYYIAGETKETFCNSCYKTYPRCRACDLPMRRSNLTRDGVCYSCAEKLPKCKACGKTIVGAHFVHKFKGEYCWQCQRSRPECSACGAPVSNIHWKLPDGRHLCDSCKRQSVFREDQARTIMDDVVNLVRRRLGLVVTRPWTLRVDKLNTEGTASVKAARQGLRIASPISGNEMGIFIERGDQREIVLLYGVPIPLIYETAAHELTHAWQSENCPPDQSLELREGFAQWVAAKILEVKGFTNSLEKLQSRMDNPYGTGYQRMARIERTRGESRVINYVRTAVR